MLLAGAECGELRLGDATGAKLASNVLRHIVPRPSIRDSQHGQRDQDSDATGRAPDGRPGTDERSEDRRVEVVCAMTQPNNQLITQPTRDGRRAA